MNNITAQNLEQVLSRNWWALVIRGVLGIVFGFLAFAWPGPTLATLVILFGAYAFADGVFALLSAIKHKTPRPGFLILEGVVGVGVGVATFLWPGVTALSLLILIAVWSIATGLLEIYTAIRLRKAITNEWFLGIAGIISVLFGVLLLARPGAGALTVIWMIGTYAVVFGALLIFLGDRLRRHNRRFNQPHTQTETPFRRSA